MRSPVRPLVETLIAILLFSLLPAVALAGTEPPEYSLEQAVSRALSYSRTLEKADLKRDDAEDARVSAAAAFHPSGLYDYNPDAEPAYYAKEATDFAWQVAEKEYDCTRDTVIMDTVKKYYDVLNAKVKVQAKEAALASLEQQAKTTQALFNAGMASKYAVSGINAKLTGTRAEVTAANGALDEAYLALNLQLGLKPNDRPVLTTGPEYSPVTLDLATYENRAIQDNPTLWIATNNVKFLDVVQGWDSGTGAEVSTNDIEVAKLDALNAKDTTRILVRKLYNGVLSLEDAYRTAEEGVRVAQEQYDLVQLKYSLGMATKSDVVAAETALVEARQGLFDLTVQHTIMRLALEKPWAYLSVMSS